MNFYKTPWHLIAVNNVEDKNIYYFIITVYKHLLEFFCSDSDFTFLNTQIVFRTKFPSLIK